CSIIIEYLLCNGGDLAGAEYYLKKSIHVKPSVEGFVNLGNIMVDRSKPDKAVSYFNNALQLDQYVSEAYCGIGNALYLKGRFQKALRYFHKALSLEGKKREPAIGISKVYRRIIPDWHFAMMNDITRNTAYEKAIRENTESSTVTLDIGSGGGLLSLMAARAGAQKVYTCEQNEVLANKAAEVIENNGFSEKIVLLKKRSQKIKLKKDMPRKADLLVSEIFDAGLIGENALYVLKHAKENLLKRGGKIIPREAIVFGVLAECQDLVDKYRMDHVSGFDFNSFNDFSLHGYAQERVCDYNIRYLSRIFEVFHFDFHNIKLESLVKKIPVRMLRKGRADAVIFWFRLFLTEKIWLDTGLQSTTHWKQAVQFITPERDVRKDQVILVSACNNNASQISFSID
ncbi:MAG: tetratricopeptide repeat protein, partial [Nitrospinota bacterium]